MIRSRPTDVSEESKNIYFFAVYFEIYKQYSNLVLISTRIYGNSVLEIIKKLFLQPMLSRSWNYVTVARISIQRVLFIVTRWKVSRIKYKPVKSFECIAQKYFFSYNLLIFSIIFWHPVT